jgi:hypothetical protein
MIQDAVDNIRRRLLEIDNAMDDDGARGGYVSITEQEEVAKPQMTEMPKEEKKELGILDKAIDVIKGLVGKKDKNLQPAEEDSMLQGGRRGQVGRGEGIPYAQNPQYNYNKEPMKGEDYPVTTLQNPANPMVDFLRGLHKK